LSPGHNYAQPICDAVVGIGTPPRPRVVGMDEILITGASGFIGRRLMERLRDDGRDVRGIDISTDLNRRVVAGDIAEEGPWQAAAEGCDTVIHAAAATTPIATREVRWRTNVLGTRRVLDAAIAAGAKRFVHVSTVRAYGDTDFPDGVDESYPVRIDGDAYADTKVAAEQVVLQAHAAGEIECTILRAGDVYGPGSRAWTVLPVEAIRSHRFVLPAKGRGVFSPLYVDNLIDAVAQLGPHPESAGRILNVTDGVGMPCREFFGHYSRMLGKGPPPVLPTLAAIGLAAVPEAAARIGGTDTDSNRAAMRWLARPGTYSIARARALGFEPAVGIDEGMQRTEEWLGEHGLLRGTTGHVTMRGRR
jgi:nucleoside-diphosphate-sugar epimerase